MPEVDDYLASLDEPARLAFERIRKLALELAPDADQSTSYGMAALRYKGKPLLGFRVAKGHLSIFPFSPDAIDAARAELEGFDLSKGTMRFTATKPPPDAAVKAIVRHRMKQIDLAG